MKDERERLYSVLETLPAYVALMTRDYRMTSANRVFRELLETLKGDSVLGISLSDRTLRGFGDL